MANILDLEECEFAFQVVSDDYGEALELANTVRLNLQNIAGQTEGTDFVDAVVLTESDGYELEPDQSGQVAYSVPIVFKILSYAA